MAEVNARVQKHRAALRLAGLRPVQLWVPDTRRPDFEEECRQQSLRVAKVDQSEIELQRLMDAAALEIEGWSE
jgi:hypothetical protein